MDNQNLIIFKFTTLYEILKELENSTNFKIYDAINDKALAENKNKLTNYIILTPIFLVNNPKQLILEKLPIRIRELTEKINIEFLKFQYNDKSEIKLGKYIINLNSREIIEDDKKLKLTEKEIKIIVYLSNINKPASINELQLKVWGYHLKLETHTVETHIYRLRDKISKFFKNEKFIVSQKNGYKININ